MASLEPRPVTLYPRPRLNLMHIFLSHPRSLIVTASISAALFSVVPARAASLSWDSDATFANGSTDGPGSWNTTTANWNNGAANVAWVNANNDSAVFGNGGVGGTSPATVTLGTGITTNGLTFNTSSLASSYILSTNTLTFAGATPTITTNADATIVSAMAGTVLWKWFYRRPECDGRNDRLH
jgi:hypothetical protein